MKIIEEPIVDYITKISIVSAQYISGFKIELTFNDGSKKTVDFEDFLAKNQHPSIVKYLNLELFKSFKIVNGNLNWNNYDLIFPISDLKNGQISNS